MRREHLLRARDAIAARDQDAVTFRNSSAVVGGGWIHQASAEYMIASLDPHSGWAAALDALEVECALRAHAIDLAQRILASTGQLGVSLGRSFGAELDALSEASRVR